MCKIIYHNLLLHQLVAIWDIKWWIKPTYNLFGNLFYIQIWISLSYIILGLHLLQHKDIFKK